jgi:hypothetical protein
MNKVKRRRNKAVTIRMTEEEYAIFLDKVEESGLSQQAYIISAMKGGTITSSDEIAVLTEISKTFCDLVYQLRGLGTNINQLARVANGQGVLPAMQELMQISVEINDYRKESEEIWQSTRLLISQPNPTVPCGMLSNTSSRTKK